MHARSFGGVVAVNGLEGGEFKPLGEEVRRGRSGKSAHVCPGEREAADAEVDELRDGHAEVVPCGTIVAGPGGAVALATGVAGTGHDEGTLVGPEGKGAFKGGAGVLHAEDVVDLQMRGGAFAEAGLVDAVLDVEGHGFAGAIEDGGLVHIVPEAGDTLGDEALVEGAPPLAGPGLGEVREDAVAGPDFADVDGAVGVLDEVVAGGAGIVRGVACAGLLGDVEVRDDDQLEVLPGEVLDHAGKVGVVLFVDGEGPVFVLEVNV